MSWIDTATKWIGQQWNNITGKTTQMDWQERMDNTKVQRSVEDMNAAGINPAMAYSNGGASSAGGVPSGASGVNAAGSFIPNTMNSIANVAKAFNHDKDKSNNVTFNDTLSMINTVARMMK